MKGRAFCPAHVTGFFKAHLGDGLGGAEEMGSVGAGFSIREGVTTTVSCRPGTGHTITAGGYLPEGTGVSEAVLGEFLGLGGAAGKHCTIHHEIGVPIGYGLGSSGAVALSLALALNEALGTGFGREEIGRIAHRAEIQCKTGLGDVLASYHGGFEIRTRPGAPGTGKIEKIPAGGISVVMACFAPISTEGFIRDRLAQINGIGGKMTKELLKSRDHGRFQDMSLEFAEHAGVMTPRMRRVADDLSRNGIRCGVALFGETIFSMVPAGGEDKVAGILRRHSGDAVILRSRLDDMGARVLDA